MVEHRGVVHRIEWLQQTYGLGTGERTTLKHSYTFGLSEWEIFWPLSGGGMPIKPRSRGHRRSRRRRLIVLPIIWGH